MNNLKKFTWVLAASLLLVLPNLTGAPPARPEALTPVAHTGVVPLGPNQVLRITINTGSGNDTLTVRVTTAVYVGGSSGGIWKTTNISQATFGPVVVLPSEAASIDVDRGVGIAVQAIVFCNNTNVHVTGEIIDSATGEVQGIIAILIA